MSNIGSASSSGSGVAGGGACDAGIFGPGFTGHLDWETDPGWKPGCWNDVTLAMPIDKKHWPVHIYLPHVLSEPLPPSPSGDSSSSFEGDRNGDKDKLFECWICRKTYKRKNDARIHVGEVHLALYRFFCPICPHKTSRGWSYNRHLRNVHKVNDKEAAEKEKEELKTSPTIKKKKTRRRSGWAKRI